MNRIIIKIILIIFFCYCKNNNKKTIPINEKKNVEISSTSNLEHIDSTLKLDSKNAYLWVKKAQLYLINKQTDSAIFCYEKAIQLNPKNTDFKLALAYLFAENKNSKTLTLCNQLLKNNQPLLNPKIYYIQGVYYSSISDINKAILNFDKCINKDWTFIDAYLEKGILLLKKKRPQEALKVFKLAIKTSNRNAEIYYWLGRTFEELGNYKSAKNLYKQSLFLDPNFTIAKTRLKNIISPK